MLENDTSTFCTSDWWLLQLLWLQMFGIRIRIPLCRFPTSTYSSFNWIVIKHCVSHSMWAETESLEAWKMIHLDDRIMCGHMWQKCCNTCIHTSACSTKNSHTLQQRIREKVCVLVKQASLMARHAQNCVPQIMFVCEEALTEVVWTHQYLGTEDN